MCRSAAIIAIAALLFAGCGNSPPLDSAASPRPQTSPQPVFPADGKRKEVKTLRVVTETPIDTEYFKYHDKHHVAVSADCRHIGYSCNLIKDGAEAETFVVEDGVNHGIFGELDRLGFTYGPCSDTLMYFIKSDEDCLNIVIDGIRRKSYVTEPGFLDFPRAGEKYAFLATDEAERVFVFVNDTRYGPYKSVQDLNTYGYIIFSPDGNRTAFAAIPMDGENLLPVIDGEIYGKYIGVKQIEFSWDSKKVLLVAKNEEGAHYSAVIGEEEKTDLSNPDIMWAFFVPRTYEVAVIAVEGNTEYVVADGRPRERHKEIQGISFSEDGAHMAYIGGRRSKYYVVIDDERLGPYVRATSVRFAGDGNHSFFIGTSSGKWHPVVNGIPGPAYSDVMKILVNPTRSEILFAACTEPEVEGASRDWRIVTCAIDDSGKASYRDSAIYPWIGGLPCDCGYSSPSRDPTLSPDGSRLAFYAKAEGKDLVVLDGESAGEFDSIDTLSFNPDGTRFGFYAVSNEETFIVIDGIEGKHFERIFCWESDDHYAALKAFEWDSNNRFHYIALRDWVIYLVEEEIIEKKQ